MRRIAVSLVLLFALVFLPLLSQPPRAAALSPAAAVGGFMMYLPFVFKAVAEPMVPVYAGSFWRGCDPAVNDLLKLPCDPSGDEQPIFFNDTATTEIYTYEVSNLQYRACVAAGVGRERVCVDPGIGFGKRPEHNLALLSAIGRLADPDLPVLIGVSRKSLVGIITGRPPEGRLAGSVAFAALAVMGGAAIVRAHDVAETVDAVKVAVALKRAASGGR